MEHDDVTVLLVWNGPGVKSKWTLHEVIKGLMTASGQKETAAGDEEDDIDFEASSHKGKENRLSMKSPAGAAASGSSSSSGTKGGKRAVGDMPEKGKKKQKV